MELKGSWSAEAFKFLVENADELETNEEASRIAFPALWEVTDMFKDVDLDEDLT